MRFTIQNHYEPITVELSLDSKNLIYHCCGLRGKGVCWGSAVNFKSGHSGKLFLKVVTREVSKIFESYS